MSDPFEPFRRWLDDLTRIEGAGPDESAAAPGETPHSPTLLDLDRLVRAGDAYLTLVRQCRGLFVAMEHAAQMDPRATIPLPIGLAVSGIKEALDGLP